MSSLAAGSAKNYQSHNLSRESSNTVRLERMPHILNYGMGVDSTAILLRWLEMSDQERGFPLDDLIVLTAQTGDEFGETQQLVETYIFPLLREHHIRFVEVAKHGHSQKDGYIVLQDTNEPYSLHIDGDYALSELMIERGTLPAFTGPHKCAMKWKGFVLESWLADELDTQVFGPYLGYSSEETARAEKCEEYNARGNDYMFPLIEWGWTRAKCLEYIKSRLGVDWEKSCCKFCPFQARETAIERYKKDPEAAGFALFMEAVSLALNPKMHLFSHGSAYALAEESDNQSAIEALNRRLDATDWGLYRVERTYERPISQKSGKPFSRINRRVEQLSTGTRDQMTEELTELSQRERPVGVIEAGQGALIEEFYYGARYYSHRREEGKFPAVEGFWIVCPAVVKDKVRNAKTFKNTWDHITGSNRQLSLFDQ